ncbi:hypothetical protein D915_008553 [Fasciola hepatica]|uniref:Uncharacterized protein n=1 Tax=Fasciola hepatica TaxID=6192 RepID=A0A2H1BZ40_FASHE|nr:hypothetical protein D915_008553 [Fasciola hepatica]
MQSMNSLIQRLFCFTLLMLLLCGLSHVDGAVGNIPLQFDANGKPFVEWKNLTISGDSEAEITVTEANCYWTLSLSKSTEEERDSRSGWRRTSVFCYPSNFEN